MQNSLLKALRLLRADPSAHDASELDAYEAAWLSGYFAGLARAKLESAPAHRPGAAAGVAVAPAISAPRVAVLYGSETGNSAKLAQRLAEQLIAAGVASEVIDLAKYKARALEREQTAVFITSTHGDGTPPEPASRFFEQLNGPTAPKSLSHLRFAVLGLGDSSYEHFCRAAQTVDERLAELGAQRIVPRVDCDVDFEEPASAWMQSLLPVITPHERSPGTARIEVISAATPTAPSAALESLYDERTPFTATVLENFRLTGRGSTKETRHLTLSVDPAVLPFEPGDSLGICASNDPAVAHKLARSAGLSGDELVTVAGDRVSIATALIERLDLALATPLFLKEWALASEAPALAELVQRPEAEQRKFLRSHHVLDIVRMFPAGRVDAEQLVRGLRRLTPRLYSIASSAAAISDEVHLTIAVVRYALHGRDCSGVASGQVADRTREGDTLPVYVQSNPKFRLPADPSAKILMIGAGTGVAPYRAFIQERVARGARGQSWLFFGERNFRTDFLYQTEWQEWVRDKALSRITLAFSRDQAEKIYVQQRLLEQADDVYAWLQDGAHVYVCGDASSLAPAVHDALLAIIERHSGSRERAVEYLHGLADARRYQRDVY
jgi:sulfite reductase (NADPH) flavoprotein alpha-component